MLKLRRILLLNKFYYLVLIVSILAMIIRLTIPYDSVIHSSDSVVDGRVTSIKYDGNLLTIIVKVDYIEQIQGYYKFKTKSEFDSISRKLSLGMSVKLYGKVMKINTATIDNSFSYEKYLRIKHIYNLFSIDKINIESSHTNLFYSFKNLILKYLSSLKSGPYIKMLLLGNTDFVSDKVINSFRENGISHLFAISGTQVTVLAEGVLKLLKRLKVKEKKRYIIVNILIFIYMFLTGSPPAILRAVLFFLLSSINKYNYFYITNSNLFILTLSITIFINPYYIYDLGFLYSYSISMALIMCSRLLDNKNAFYQLVLTSIISFIISLPITLYNFYQTNFMSVIYNLFYVPYVNSILFPFAVITLFFPWTDGLFNLFIIVLEKTSLFISKIDFGKIVFPKVSIFYYILYVAIIILLYKFKYKFLYLIFIILLILHYCFYSIFQVDYVYFFDVGQGDSSLIKLNNSNVVIDTGGEIKQKADDWKIRKSTKSIVINSLIPYFRSKGIRKIDYLILTHGDFDHMGEAITLVNNFKVEKVIFNCGPYNTLEKDLIKVLDKKKIKYYSCIKELNINNNKLYFLQTKVYDNENDNSNVIYTDLNGYKFMFMGDASTTTEKEILSKYNLPDVDVLKVGHHGSKTSSGKDFINEINPRYSIISVGKNNRYGHPNKEVLDNLKESKIYRTDEDGSIMFKIKNNKLRIETCSP
ncbi:MAG: DNA internalization-related competence protein ComEC/Rec2 [Bacilli bacterium]|nr:DNA internalization-related competence protein ComEC/Rec2 [Bacilli bacterium]